MAESVPRVSVVIPSVMRETLHHAVDSALHQSYPPVEVIVAFDLGQLPEAWHPPAGNVRAILTGGGRGPNYARQLGADAAAGDAIALLDDDDFWYPGKLEAQARLLASARRDGARAVVSAGIRVVDPAGKELYLGQPQVISEGQAITDYLFRRRTIRSGCKAMVPSSLLIERDLLRAVPFDHRLRLHEDWDWLLRAGREQRVRFLMAAGTHVAYCRQWRGKSLSRTAEWHDSALWADQHRTFLSPREYGDFLLCVSVPVAVDSGARWGGLRAAWRGLRRGRPGPAAVVAAASLLMVPRGAPDAFSRWLAGWRGTHRAVREAGA